jgi:hypothetical protein
MERFDLEKLNGVEVKKEYRLEIRFGLARLKQVEIIVRS